MENINLFLSNQLNKNSIEQNNTQRNQHNDNIRYDRNENNEREENEREERRNNEEEAYNDDFEPEELNDAEQKFLKRAEVGKGQESIKKYIQYLRRADKLYLPTSGLAKRDLARLGLGLVRKTYISEIIVEDFEVHMSGCTDYNSLVAWALDYPPTRERMFTKIRHVKGSLERKEVPTLVNWEFVAAIVLNFGGKKWLRHYRAHIKIRRNRYNANQKYSVPKFMTEKSEFIPESDNKKSSGFTSSIAKMMDREITLGENPLFNEMFRKGIVTSFPDFTKYLDKLKSAGLKLSGNEKFLEINKLLVDSLKNDKIATETAEETIHRKLMKEEDVYKKQFVKLMAIIEFRDLDKEWVSDFETSEFKTINDHLEYVINRINNNIIDIYERKIAMDVFKDYIKVWFENRETK